MRNTGKLKSEKILKSGGKLGGGGKSLSAKKRLKARSKKMEDFYAESRVPFVQDFLSRNPRCMFRLWIHPTTLEESPPLMLVGGNTTSCGKLADDVHEILPRSRGGNLVPIDGDEDPYLALCREHHVYVTANPAWARKRGYTI